MCHVSSASILAGGEIAMKLSQLLTALLASAVACFMSGAEASPHVRAPMFSPLPVQAGFKCELIDGKLVCGNKKNKSEKNDDDEDDDDKPKAKKESGNICEGDNHCGAGYTDLETPNKYKSCCEPNEASQTGPKEAEKCKFPGEIGTPPNCQCPEDTEFRGFKGCLKYTEGKWCEKAYVASVQNQILSQKCRTEHSHGTLECHDTQDPIFDECCCRFRKFSE
jgi:hypothetical protein